MRLYNFLFVYAFVLYSCSFQISGVSAITSCDTLFSISPLRWGLSGGRYRVAGWPVLRRGIKLESESIGEIRPQEEVLILELGLVLRQDQPRLRAHERWDARICTKW